MVSLRRRKLLGLCTGALYKNEDARVNATYSSSPGSVYPIPFDDLNIGVEEGNDLSEDHIEPSKILISRRSYDQQNQPNNFDSSVSKELDSQPTIEQEVKRRKQHRRRRMNSQEQSVMRGVYFKNMKWQAAIKVDKKQIHLGTVSSQQDAARLYDRAAFMCGREPNFELSEEEKQQLRKLKWDEFLAMTRSAITSKRTRRGRKTEGQQVAEGSSTSDNVDLDSSTS